jgi:hypothetical protein
MVCAMSGRLRHVGLEGVGRVGETAAAQQHGELEDILVGDGQAGEPQPVAQN